MTYVSLHHLGSESRGPTLECWFGLGSHPAVSRQRWSCRVHRQGAVRGTVPSREWEWAHSTSSCAPCPVVHAWLQKPPQCVCVLDNTINTYTTHTTHDAPVGTPGIGELLLWGRALEEGQQRKGAPTGDDLDTPPRHLLQLDRLVDGVSHQAHSAL